MKKHLLNKIRDITIAVSAFLVLLFPATSLADPYQQPRLMVGQATVTVLESDGLNHTYYAGENGSYSVVNFFTDSMLGFGKNRSIVDTSNLSLCVPPKCVFGLQNVDSTSNDQTPYDQSTFLVLDSKTWVGSSTAPSVITQTPLLFTNEQLVVGDMYGYLGDKFKFWGRNLAESSGNDPLDQSASWKLGNYPLNPEAQSSWLKSDGTTETDTYKAYKDKINILMKEATEVSAASLEGANPWHLQGLDIATDVTDGDQFKYPEGKIWYVNGSLTLNSSIKYKGKGTIIVGGSLTVGDGVDVTPNDPSPSTADILGLIVANP